MCRVPESPDQYVSLDRSAVNLIALAQAQELNKRRIEARIDPTTPQRRAAYERRRDAERRMPPVSRCEGR